MINPLLRYGLETALGVVGTSVFLLGTRAADRNPTFRLYRGVLLSLAWLCGVGALYTLIQALFPSFDTSRYDTLENFVPPGVSVLSAIYFLRRARYIEDTAALVILLFAQCVLLSITLAGILPHPASPPSPLAYCAAWCAVGSATLLPCIWFDRWLQARLGPLLPLPPFLQSPRKQRPPSHLMRTGIMISACGAVASLAILAFLAAQRQLDSFVAALPPTAVMLGLYIFGTALHWGSRALFLGKPAYRSLPPSGATRVPVPVQPADEQPAEQRGEEEARGR